MPIILLTFLTKVSIVLLGYSRGILSLLFTTLDEFLGYRCSQTNTGP
jgi:hypothetical protein